MWLRGTGELQIFARARKCGPASSLFLLLHPSILKSSPCAVWTALKGAECCCQHGGRLVAVRRHFDHLFVSHVHWARAVTYALNNAHVDTDPTILGWSAYGFPFWSITLIDLMVLSIALVTAGFKASSQESVEPAAPAHGEPWRSCSSSWRCLVCFELQVTLI